MRGFTKRAVALPAAALGALALVGLGSGAAHAAVASGSVTLAVSGSFVAQLAKAGVVLVPANAASVAYSSSTNTVAITYTATGGDATLVDFAGTIDYSGSILGFSCKGKTVNLSGLLFDLTDAQFDGQTATSGETPLLDLAGSQAGNIKGTAQAYTSTDLQIDAAGAALLNSALGTTAFSAGQSVGSFSTTWTTS